MKYPRVGVLVPDEEERNTLISIIGKDTYEEHPCIFTASEIKGVEYQYVVCINVFSKYHSEWQDILSDDVAKKRETRYRFYFNLIYVALTRAQLHICFVDKYPIAKIDDILKIETFDTFNADACRFTDLGSSLFDWYEQAREYHENGVYDKAIKYYQKSGAHTSKQDIIECKIGMAELQHDYNTLIKYALLKGDLSLAQKYQNETSVSSELKEMITWFTSPTSKTGVLDMISANFKDFPQEDQLLIYALVKRKLRKEAKELSVQSIIAKGVNYGK